jgi:hypothetical protein
MALRSRLRRAFTRGSQDDPNATSSSSLSRTKTKNSTTKTEVYKHPPLKYRRPVNPEHKAHLESFTFAKAWRRRSQQSMYSPMGTRMPSRRSSFASHRRSFGEELKRSASRKSACPDDDGSLVDSGIGSSGDDGEDAGYLKEASDEEGDVTNGLYLPLLFFLH